MTAGEVDTTEKNLETVLTNDNTNYKILSFLSSFVTCW